MKEMNTVRKSVHINEELDQSNQCKECSYVMPHITTRNCTCHKPNCTKYTENKSCTIFRKISKLNVV